MEISIRTISLFGAVILTGLSAGLFYAWSVSVIPGTQKVADSTYLETMQSINRAILNSAFFLVFFGSSIFLLISSVTQYQNSKITFWLLLAAAVCYLLGTVGITGLGNVPLNDQLDTLNLSEMAVSEIGAFRKFYEINWNRLHLIRTVFALLAFLLSVLAVFSYVGRS